MLSLADALDRIKGRLAEYVPEELIRRLGHEAGHTWRERDLGPVVTAHLVLQQVLHGNVPVGELRRRGKLDFTDSAYCRARLPRAALERLQRAVTGQRQGTTEVGLDALWHGHRVFLLDGSSFSRPDTPELQEHFGQPGGQAKGCGFPVAHLLARFDAVTGYLLRTAALPLRSHDLAGGGGAARGPVPRRRAGRGPRLRLLRPPGPVPAVPSTTARRACKSSGTTEAADVSPPPVGAWRGP